jgi:hypothetical protein
MSEGHPAKESARVGEVRWRRHTGRFARAAVGTRAPAVLPHHADQTFTHMKGLLAMSIILLLRNDAGNSRESAAFFNSALGARVDDHAPMSERVSVDKSSSDC